MSRRIGRAGPFEAQGKQAPPLQVMGDWRNGGRRTLASILCRQGDSAEAFGEHLGVYAHAYAEVTGHVEEVAGNYGGVLLLA